MRFHHLLSLVLSSSLVVLAAEARASEPLGVATDDESIGTRPARASSTPVATPTETTAVEPSSGVSVFGRDTPRARTAPVASDPPGDWAVLHAGLRPRLGTFGGIATLALAHARTEKFYGGFSFSAVRNDAGTHVGLAQIALGRNLSDTFGGGVQLSISENRARTFIGLGQVALAYNRSLDFNGVTQVAAYNRARNFLGIAQVGPYNLTDRSFAGVAQIGAYNRSEKDFTGLVQLGAVSAVGPKLLTDRRSDGKQSFTGVAQLGVLDTVDGDFYGLAQIGGAAHTSGNFRGLVQVAALGAGAGSFHGLAQVGLLAMSNESIGIQAGAASIALDEHKGLQLAGATYAQDVTGAQIGLVNLAAKVRGLQIGVFNHTKSLRGVQIGLANHATDGVLPWTALLNMGFGDDVADDDDIAHAKVDRATL